MANRRDDLRHTQEVANIPREMFLLVIRVQNVRVDANDHRRHGRTSEGAIETATPAPNIVPVKRLGERDVGTGIEAFRQLDALVFQVAIDREALGRVTEFAEGIFAFVRIGAEAFVDLLLATVSQVCDPAGGAQTFERVVVGVVVVATVPVDVALNGGNLCALNANLPTRSTGGYRQDAYRIHHFWVE